MYLPPLKETFPIDKYQIGNTEFYSLGDINGDGYNDLYIGGSKGYSGSIYMWNDYKFEKYNYPLINSDKESEDTDCIFFDECESCHQISSDLTEINFVG